MKGLIQPFLPRGVWMRHAPNNPFAFIHRIFTTSQIAKGYWGVRDWRIYGNAKFSSLPYLIEYSWSFDITLPANNRRKPSGYDPRFDVSFSPIQTPQHEGELLRTYGTLHEDTKPGVSFRVHTEDFDNTLIGEMPYMFQTFREIYGQPNKRQFLASEFDAQAGATFDGTIFGDQTPRIVIGDYVPYGLQPTVQAVWRGYDFEKTLTMAGEWWLLGSFYQPAYEFEGAAIIEPARYWRYANPDGSHPTYNEDNGEPV